jgi:hypothetical protein
VTAAADRSGVAGERSDSQIDSEPSPTHTPAPDPVKPAATILAGAGMVPVSWGEAVKVATPASRAASVSRTALADRAIVETLTERDDAEEWADRLAHAISLAAGIDIGEHSNLNDPWEQALAAAPLIAAQALRQAAEEIRAYYGWLDGPEQPQCGVVGKAPNGDRLDCTQPPGPHEEHCDGTRDNMWWRDGQDADV